MAKETVKLHSPLMWAFRAMDDPEYRAAVTRQSGSEGAGARSGRRLSRSYGISERALLSEVRHDLQALLNTTNLNSTQDLSAYPEVASSIINYGLPDLSTHAVDSARIDVLAKQIREAIIRFEPRMDPATLEIHPEQIDQDGVFKVRFHIKAILRCDPIRISSEFVADLDRAFGRLKIVEATT